MGYSVYTINFLNAIGVHEIPQFRGAVISTVGRDNNLLFHNHKGDGFRYSYPLIQYKRLRGKAAIVCMGDGVDAVRALLCKEQAVIVLSDRHLLNLAVGKVVIQNCCFAVCPECIYEYGLRRWLPFNSENYQRYCSIQNLSDRIEMLERIVIGNVLSMAGGLNMFVDKRIVAKITSIREYPRTIQFKGVKMVAFDVIFLTNIELPENVGLGKGCSIGFGVVEKLRNKKNI